MEINRRGVVRIFQKSLLALMLAFEVMQGGALPASPTSACDPGCGTGQHCCEHNIGTFCADQACAYTYTQAKCVPEDQSCQDFWCGSQHCQKGWFSSQNVCCVYQGSDAESYSCTPSILSCRGNTERLTIRTKKADSSS